jgi:hypothetical protein
MALARGKDGEVMQRTQDQRATIEAAGWTEEEVAGFVQAMASFRDELSPRQREALNAILAAAGAAVHGDDARGHLVVTGIIGVVIGMLVPAIQGPSSPGGASAGALSGLSQSGSGRPRA